MDINKQRPSDLVLIQITDLHIFTKKNAELNGVNTYRSLQAVLAQIKQDFPDFNLMLATGDLVEEEEQTAYENVQEILKSVKQPIYSLPGNHDAPELMENMFGQNDRNNHILCTAQIRRNNWAIFFLNSHKPATHSGYLNPDVLKALDEGLGKTRDLNVLICLHHHPVPIKCEWMDGKMLENPRDFFAVMDKYDHVKGVIWGHIHQEFSQIRNNVLLLGAPSTCTQYLPRAKKFTIDTLQPGYRWLKLSEDGNIETGINRLSQETILSRK